MPNILIIDDDAHINDIVSKALQSNGYTVSKAYSGTEALMLLSQQKPDLILLDLMLPGLSGEELLPRIKNIPVIVVSAKTDVTDKVELLVGGAADYVTKPFDMKEMLARIMVQLRKNEKSADKSLLTYREITLDTDKHTLSANGREKKLTRTEFAIMKLFMNNPGRALSREEILSAVWGEDYKGEVKIVDVNIRRLRIKIEDKPTEPEFITTVWGFGYKWGY